MVERKGQGWLPEPTAEATLADLLQLPTTVEARRIVSTPIGDVLTELARLVEYAENESSYFPLDAENALAARAKIAGRHHPIFWNHPKDQPTASDRAKNDYSRELAEVAQIRGNSSDQTIRGRIAIHDPENYLLSLGDANHTLRRKQIMESLVTLIRTIKCPKDEASAEALLEVLHQVDIKASIEHGIAG